MLGIMLGKMLGKMLGGVIRNDELKAIKTINCIIMMIKLNLNARMGSGRPLAPERDR